MIWSMHSTVYYKENIGEKIILCLLTFQYMYVVYYGTIAYLMFPIDESFFPWQISVNISATAHQPFPQPNKL